MTSITIPESDVLIASTLYLIQRGVIPYQFSIAAGRGIDTSGARNKLMNAFAAIDYSPTFSGNGADILALSKTEWWLVECKGAGTGQAQTQRNNFDRALASCVSYFEDNPNGLPDGFAEVHVFIDRD